MAESYDKKSRILYVLKLLWEESDELHPVSAASLSKKLETYGIKCERRSIFHCFDMLEEFGFDKEKPHASVSNTQGFVPFSRNLINFIM